MPIDRKIFLIGNTTAARAMAAMTINTIPEGWIVEMRPGKQQKPAVETSSEQLGLFDALSPMPKKEDVPRCFESARVYQLWLLNEKDCDRPIKSVCRDCNIERRDAMIKQGRCDYPETVFVELRGEGNIGLRRDDPGWYGALTGKYQGSGKKASSQTIATASREAMEKRYQ
jgi:hypothetical protein